MPCAYANIPSLYSLLSMEELSNLVEYYNSPHLDCPIRKEQRDHVIYQIEGRDSKQVPASQIQISETTEIVQGPHVDFAVHGNIFCLEVFW
jgi:hypothetical protein